MNEFLKESLNAFLETENISNITFAEWYGTTPNYVSQMRNGHRNIDLSKFATALTNNGYCFKIDENTLIQLGFSRYPDWDGKETGTNHYRLDINGKTVRAKEWGASHGFREEKTFISAGIVVNEKR